MIRDTYVVLAAAVLLGAAVAGSIAQNQRTQQDPAQQPGLNQQQVQQRQLQRQQQILQQQQQQRGLAPGQNANEPVLNTSEDLMDRLRAQSEVNVGPQLTLTGRLVDFHTFFFGDIFNTAGLTGGATPQLQGQPIAPGASDPNLPGSVGRGSVTNNPGSPRLAQQNTQGGVPRQDEAPGRVNPQPNVAPGPLTQQQQQQNVAPGLAAPGVNQNLQGLNPGFPGGAVRSGMGSPIIFQTASATFLAMADPTTTGVGGLSLQPTGDELIRVRARVLERNGVRVLLISGSEQTGRTLSPRETGDLRSRDDRDNAGERDTDREDGRRSAPNRSLRNQPR